MRQKLILSLTAVALLVVGVVAGGVINTFVLTELGGSGTSGYIPKFTDETTLGNSVIYDSDGEVGIGTTNPSQKLEVDGHAIATPIAGKWLCYSTDSGAGNWEWDSQHMNTEPGILEWTAGADNIKIAKAGYYLVIASVVKSAVSSGEQTSARISKNGDYIALSYAFASGQYHHHHLSAVEFFNANDVVRVYNPNADSDRFGTTAPNSVLSIYRLN